LNKLWTNTPISLKTSEYLLHTAIRNIEGEISFEEANELLETYYEENDLFSVSPSTDLIFEIGEI
jgi:hypothetical protein